LDQLDLKIVDRVWIFFDDHFSQPFPIFVRKVHF